MSESSALTTLSMQLPASIGLKADLEKLIQELKSAKLKLRA